MLWPRQIRLSTKSFDAECAEVAARGFTNVAASLTDVDLSDVIAGRPEAQALEALRIMTRSLQVRQPSDVTHVLLMLEAPTDSLMVSQLSTGCAAFM